MTAPRTGRDRAFATATDDTRLRYDVLGGGPGTPLLLVAGTGYAGATWRPDQVEALASSRRVIVFDHRGTGRSGSSAGEYTTRRFAADAASILDAVGAGPAHVVGHSMGGRVAQWLVLDRPDLVATLVLAASGPGRSMAHGATALGVPFGTALGIARDGYRAHLRHQITTTFFTPEYVAAQPGDVDWLVRAFWASRPNLEDYLKHVVARQAHDTVARLGEIRTPTLVLVGTRDTHAGATGSHWDQSRYLAEHVPGATFRSVDDVAHGLFWQSPGLTTAILLEWLDR